MPRIVVDGQEIEAPSGATILQVLHSLGREISSSCYDERLTPFGACRQCLVRVSGSARPVASCTTPVVEDMEIDSMSDSIQELRRNVLRLVAERFPQVSESERSEFQGYLRQAGIADETGTALQPGEVDNSHPYIQVDMSKCIFCYRCVRICEDLQGQFVWQAIGRGDNMRIEPDNHGAFGDSSCVSCGACADTCPTEAIVDKTLVKYGAPDRWTRTTCPYCGVGCELNVGVKDGRIVQVLPVNESPVSKGHLCVKGRYAHQFGYAPDRVTSPMIRRNGSWENVSWDEAIAFAASEFERLKTTYGPQSVGVLGSARATNEENYLAQKFARVVLETNNVDCCARVCHAPSAAALKMTLGTGAATSSFDDIERASALLLCGTNATENHPIVGARMKQAALKGAKLIVIDPRRIELAEYATHHLQLRAGTNIPLLHSMAHVIIEEGLVDEQFIAERTSDFEAFKACVKEWTPERAGEICDVDPEEIRSAAKLFATSKPAICFHGLGMTEHLQGTEGVVGIVNLALLTGSLGKPGTGVNPLRGQNNVQGSAHMGCEPSNLTGMVDIDKARGDVEVVWSAPVPKEPGLNMLQMIDRAGEGSFKGIWAIGYDFYMTNANSNVTAESMRNMELVIIQDMFLTETAKEFGTIFFPCATSYEKDGTFMNSERRVQRVRKVIEPAGESKPDWEIVCMLAKAMGKGEFFTFSSPEEVWDEVRRVWKAGGGISYKRIETSGLQWPCPTEEHPGTTMLHTLSFPIGDRAGFRSLEYIPTDEKINDAHPFLLTTGRSLYHFNAGTMTLRTDNLVIRPTDTLDLSPDDASLLDLSEGDSVLIRSRFGETTLPAHITDALKPGELFSTFHSPELHVNRATSAVRDRYVGAPEYKVTAVSLTKITNEKQT